MGSNPDRCISFKFRSFLGNLGEISLTASTIAFMWAGVVPQHPPTMLTSPS